MLGKIVTVTVDRPLGSYHPDYPDLYYPVNYGYIKGTVAGDGEEIDAYVLGIDTPVSELRGRVVAIIHRKNDTEDKLVVAPDNVKLTEKEILDRTFFQERYFDIEIII
nr:inorganic diphosphatase [Clostridia bacterium]